MWVLVALTTGACMPSGTAPVAPASPGPTAAGRAGGANDLAAGFGSLRLEDVSLDLLAGALRIRVTPLDEAITRLTAPDTSERLAAARARIDGPHTVFLVAVETEAPGGVDFDPLDLEIATRGTVHRASDIRALTTGWGAGRLEQRRPEQALYVFPESIDPTEEWAVRYGEARNDSWAARMPALEAERARVRARGGGRIQSSSRPNFLILR
jgi:hypothetical protein